MKKYLVFSKLVFSGFFILTLTFFLRVFVSSWFLFTRSGNHHVDHAYSPEYSLGVILSKTCSCFSCSFPFRVPRLRCVAAVAAGFLALLVPSIPSGSLRFSGHFERKREIFLQPLNREL